MLFPFTLNFTCVYFETCSKSLHLSTSVRKTKKLRTRQLFHCTLLQCYIYMNVSKRDTTILTTCTCQHSMFSIICSAPCKLELIIRCGLRPTLQRRKSQIYDVPFCGIQSNKERTPHNKCELMNERCV